MLLAPAHCAFCTYKLLHQELIRTKGIVACSLNNTTVRHHLKYFYLVKVIHATQMV